MMTDIKDKNENEDKPLLQLFQMLIKERDKQNTLMSNEQVMDILQKELQCNLTQLHALEVDIYMSLVKKFLKEWPEWDEFDKLIEKLKTNEDILELNNALIEKYNGLKTYLKTILDYNIPATKEMVEKVMKERAKKVPKEEKKTGAQDVVMEVQCTRAQLNHLFFRRPNPWFNNSIFNVSDSPGPSRISLNTLSLKSIFNWSLVSIHINLNVFVYKRETLHRMRHSLINKVLQPHKTKPKILDTDLFEKELPKASAFNKDKIATGLTKISNYLIKKNPLLKNLINTIFDLVHDDFRYMPDQIKVPGKFKRIANEYPYLRYLYADVDSEADKEKYDLQLEEQITPSFHYYIAKAAINFPENTINISNDWLRIECIYCQVKFYGIHVIENIEQHFNEVHHQEMDWQCMNCMKWFTMGFLAEQKWYHKC